MNMRVHERRFRLGFFCPNDPRSWSSIPWFILQTLCRVSDIEVVELPFVDTYRPSWLKRIWKRLERQRTGRIYLWEKETAHCRYISRGLDRSLAAQPCDAALVFFAEGCGFSHTRTPLFCYADSLFGARLGLYPDQPADSIQPRSLAEGRAVAQAGLQRLAKLFTSSHWAVARAIGRFGYELPPAKWECLGIGANLPWSPQEAPAPPVADDRVSFAWVGSNWTRKRGDFAVSVVRSLRQRGLNAELNVVGNVRPPHQEPWLRLHGRVEYATPTGRQLIEQIYGRSQALLLPTSGDTTPLVISEAFAFGRPVIATPVGGIPEMVEHDKTGLLLDATEPGAWAETIQRALQSGLLTAMGKNCRAKYERDLNWDVICRRMLDRIRSAVLPSRAVGL